MKRLAVIQNQSESLRASYADVARNFERYLTLPDYSFVSIDASNIEDLFRTASPVSIGQFDAVFITTNALSDGKTRDAIMRNAGSLRDFVEGGKGFYLGYQKKMSVSDQAASELGQLLPPPYGVAMLERPKSEGDSSQGAISVGASVSAGNNSFLLLSSPNAVDAQLVMEHCRENDFKAHVYRSSIRPENEAAYEIVLEDISYDDQRRLILANRSFLNGERVVVSTIAIDWEGHWRLLENIIRFICEGIPRVALISDEDNADSRFKFVQSTAKILGVTNRQYNDLSVPVEFQKVHDVYVVSAKWKRSEVEEFWNSISHGEESCFKHARQFRRLYHLGDATDASSSLARYVNYTSIDVLINQGLLWIESSFEGGLWSGGFWNTHDVLLMMDGLGLPVNSFLPAVLNDIESHLHVGGYDAVMGPSCGLLSLLNRLSIKNTEVLEACGFDLATRTSIARWIIDNLEGQSDVARNVAAIAIFGSGGADVVDALESEGKGELLRSLKASSRSGQSVSVDLLPSLSDMDLVRVVRLANGVATLEPSLKGALDELRKRQNPNGLWGSIGKTANIVVNLLELSGGEGEFVLDTDWQSSISLAVEAIRARFDDSVSSWAQNIQDTSMCIHALGLYRNQFFVESQELFETIEADLRTTEHTSAMGRSRIDLGDLFSREIRREKHLADLIKEIEDANQKISSLKDEAVAHSRSRQIFKIIAVASFLLFFCILFGMFMSEREALFRFFDEGDPLITIVIGALIAVPVALALNPRSKR